MTSPARRRALAGALAGAALLALGAAVLWWPVPAGGGLSLADHAPLYFLLSGAYFVCAGALGVAVWSESSWAESLVYGWAAVLAALCTALLLYDPFGRAPAGLLVAALMPVGAVLFFAVLRVTRPQHGGTAR